MKSDFLNNMAPNAQRAFLTTIVLSAVAVAIYMFAVVPEGEALAKATTGYSDEETNRTRIDAILRNATKERALHEDAGRRLDEYRRHFLEKRLGNYATHARELHTLVVRKDGFSESVRHPKIRSSKTSQANVRLKRIYRPDTEIVTARGSYQEAVSFLLRTEQELPLVTLQSMKISADRSNPRKQVLSFVFEWPTFDPTPPRKPKGGRK